MEAAKERGNTATCGMMRAAPDIFQRMQDASDELRELRKG